MNTINLAAAFTNLINTAYAFQAHLQSCVRLNDCTQCRQLLNAKNNAQEKYDVLVYGKPAADDLPMMFRKQAD